MILNTTYKSKDNDELINDLVGKPFGLIKAVKMKGVGFQRMIIENVSPNMRQYLNKVDDINYANLELRPLGILIRINKGLKNFTWIIPFQQLTLNKNESRIYGQDRYIQFKRNMLLMENESFFEKMIAMKNILD